MTKHSYINERHVFRLWCWSRLFVVGFLCLRQSGPSKHVSKFLQPFKWRPISGYGPTSSVQRYPCLPLLYKRRGHIFVPHQRRRDSRGALLLGCKGCRWDRWADTDLLWNVCGASVLLKTLRECLNSSLFSRHHSPLPCFVCSVQSTVNFLVQSKSHLHHRGSLHPGAPLLYEVNLFFCLTQCSLRSNTVSIFMQATRWFYT